MEYVPQVHLQLSFRLKSDTLRVCVRTFMSALCVPSRMLSIRTRGGRGGEKRKGRERRGEGKEGEGSRRERGGEGRGRE